MAFYAYILRCSDGTYYTGHTEDLDVRLAQHERGAFPSCYTFSRRPVTLLWSEAFAERADALSAERRIKGWGRGKKEALIAGDWERVSRLARNRQSQRPSTSSGRTGKGESSHALAGSGQTRLRMTRTLVRVSLRCHPQTPASSVTGVETRLLQRTDGAWLFEYVVTDPDQSLAIPAARGADRTDELWRSTCFELFVTMENGQYRELNFAPSLQWAAYRFDGYRSGMRDSDVVQPPEIAPLRTGDTFRQLVVLDREELSAGARLALSAVIEETDGTKSYWALAHPPGKPDFHHPACFVLELPAPMRA